MPFEDIKDQYLCPLSNTQNYRDWGSKAWDEVYSFVDSPVNQMVKGIMCRLQNVSAPLPASDPRCKTTPSASDSCHPEEQKCHSAGQGGVSLEMAGSDEDHFAFTLNMECGFECAVTAAGVDIAEAIHVLQFLEDILTLAMDAGKSSHCSPYQPDATGDTAKDWYQAAKQISEKVTQGYTSAASGTGSATSVLETQEPYRNYMAKLFPPEKR